jgi:hypothetical protein
VTELPQPIGDVVGEARIVLVGGVDAESAVVCGGLEPVRDDASVSVSVLEATHDTSHVGMVLVRDTGEGTMVDVVVAVPQEPEASPSAQPSSDPSASPDASALSPVRSAEPGTSGAPPFSPLPAGDPDP